MYKPRRVLFLSAHPDDELNAAGTLNKLSLQDAEMHYAVFTQCKKDTLELGFNPKDLLNEMRCSLKVICNKVFIHLRDYEERKLPLYRQLILEEMINLNKQISPDLVIAPNTEDLHQDHITIIQEARRAFRYCSIFGYESVRAPIISKNICFIKLKEDNWIAKRDAMKCYKTQTSRIDIIARKALMQVRGSQVDYPYAEVFEVVRLCS